MALKNAGLSQKEIAEQEGLSQAKVTRALQAASVCAELLAFFPVQSELTFSDYKTLSAVEETLLKNDIALKTLTDSIASEVDIVLSDTDLAEDEVKNRIMRIIAREGSCSRRRARKTKRLFPRSGVSLIKTVSPVSALKDDSSAMSSTACRVTYRMNSTVPLKAF